MAYTRTTVARPPLPVKEILPEVFAFPPSLDSFGGISYLIRRDDSMFMVDVPEYLEQHLNFISEKRKLEFDYVLCGHGGRRVIKNAKEELKSFLGNYG